MRIIIEKKLDKITDIWNDFILEYKFCNSKIKFTDDVRSNYYGDILHYFLDTLEIVFKKSTTNTFSDNFENSISFLQAIYLQQDFMEELLYIFKCGINKGDLKKDDRYQINRNIRNELVGHPIRKIEVPNVKTGDNELVLFSSAIFSNQLSSERIAYLRYHRINNYSFESIIHLKTDILARHIEFLNHYFDVLLEKLKSILSSFLEKVNEIAEVLRNASFERIITVVSHSFESIFDYDRLYKPEYLLSIYKKKNCHPRYQNAIALFLKDLELFLMETKERIIEFKSESYLEPGKAFTEENKITYSKRKISPAKSKESYRYEISKLYKKREFSDFQFFSSMLRDKCQDKPQVLIELANMERNRENEIEYYCSHRLIKMLLNEN